MTYHSIIILTTSGGGGHLQAAAALKERYIEENPGVKIVVVDILKEWLGPLGRGAISLWNQTLQLGLYQLQHLFAEGHPWLDPLCSLVIRKKLFALIEEVHPDLIIDTQTMGFPGICEAAFLSKIRFEKQMVELPTVHASLYFTIFANLPQQLRSSFFLRTLPPLLEEGQTDEEFWKKHTGLSMDQILYVDPPLRKPFFTNTSKELSLRLDEPSQLSLMKHYGIDVSDSISTLTPTHPLLYVALGSQPSKDATLAYMMGIQKLWKGTAILSLGDREKNRAFCEVVCDTLSSVPSEALIIPVFYQDANVLASCIQHSDLLITRSGGITSHELFIASHGNLYIHSETDSSIGMPPWEHGNFLYLEKTKGAKLITPSTVDQILEEYIGQLRR